MKRQHLILAGLCALLPLRGFAHSGDHAAAPSECSPAFYKLGPHHMSVTTRSQLAQQHFDQGLAWAYAFNHEEAVRNFRMATRLDQSCAMCYWGIAYALGPNINAEMSEDASRAAFDAVSRAEALKSLATVAEQAFIAALAKRYSPDAGEERAKLDQAYAQAMGELSRTYPADLDAATLHAESLMNTTPWDYWTHDGSPLPATTAIISALEGVLAKNPLHPGANHFYIHLAEARHPDWAEAAADRLLGLAPDAGHMEHMPSHIYIRLGRYHDAVLSNQRGIAADKAFLANCSQRGIYRAMYVPHNYDFLSAAAALEGNRKLTLDTAKELADLAQPLLQGQHVMLGTQQFRMAYLMSLVRFGLWKEVLAEPSPTANLRYSLGLWHFARAMGFTRSAQPTEAQREIAALKSIADNPALGEPMRMERNPPSAILMIAYHEANGELLASQGRWDEAVGELSEAATRQDQLNYIEPPSWFHSVRLPLGEVLLTAGRPQEAEEAFRKDLAAFPENGWGLRGLQKALVAQGRMTEAAQVEKRFAKAWQHADTPLFAARF